ncbi:TPA: hypothetical protein ACQFCQ_001210 [Escherichia coli]
MKYKMLYTLTLIYVELESDSDAWNLVKEVDTNQWYMANLDEQVVTDYFIDFNTLSEEEFFQMQLVVDMYGHDMVTLRNIQKVVNEFQSKKDYEVGAYYDIDVQ